MGEGPSKRSASSYVSGFGLEGRRRTYECADSVYQAVEDPKLRRRRLVGRNIRLARERAGFSQQQLALQLDMERHHLSDWETGRHEPSAAGIERLATVLELPTWWFYQPHDDEAA